jgi:hypothetical protein
LNEATGAARLKVAQIRNSGCSSGRRERRFEEPKGIAEPARTKGQIPGDCPENGWLGPVTGWKNVAAFGRELES